MIPVDVLERKGAIIKSFEVGEIIYGEGSGAHYYYQIISGRVRLSNFLEDGKEVLHNVLVGHDCFGEVAIFEAGNHLVTAIADSVCVLLRLRAIDFVALLEEEPIYHAHFMQLVSKDLRFKLFITKLICGACPETILLHLIQYLNQAGKLVCPACNRLMLTRQQLANMTGLRVETVIRTLKQLEKSDKLNIIRGKVFIPADGLG